MPSKFATTVLPDGSSVTFKVPENLSYTTVRTGAKSSTSIATKVYSAIGKGVVKGGVGLIKGAAKVYGAGLTAKYATEEAVSRAVLEAVKVPTKTAKAISSYAPIIPYAVSAVEVVSDIVITDNALSEWNKNYLANIKAQDREPTQKEIDFAIQHNQNVQDDLYWRGAQTMFGGLISMFTPIPFNWF